MNQEEKTRVLATKLMGWEIFGYDDAYQRSLNGQEVLAFYGLKDDVWMTHKDAAPTPWNPYESIADAWMVLEEVRKPGLGPVADRRKAFMAALRDLAEPEVRAYDSQCHVHLPTFISRLTPAMICDAAYQAVTAISPPSSEAHTTGETDPSGVNKDAGAI